MTVLVTTHYIEEVEACDRVCIIDNGKVQALDTPDALKKAHGKQLLRIVPRSEADRRDFLSRYADRVVSDAGEEIVLASDDGFVEAFLSDGGNRIRALSIDVPNLATVFLSLTGEDLRDRAAGARERTYAFGQKGGEHTR